MRHGMRPMLVIWAMAAGLPSVAAEEARAPARTPATAPTTQAVSPGRLEAIRSMLGRLASVNCENRQKARRELMGLSRSELPALREVIRTALPLEPSQAAVLRDIVTHVYLAGDSYPSQGDGFLGVTLPSYFHADQRALLSLERGVAVVKRLPGFCAFRMFEDGDVILCLSDHPDVEFKTPEQLTNVVKTARAGQMLSFDVIRHGQIVPVPIRLDLRPTAVDQASTFTEDRERAAQEVWDRDFAPVLAPPKRQSGMAGVSGLD